MVSEILIRDLHFSYDREEVLRGIDIKVRAGGINALLGPNGSGKTTILKCLVGILRPLSGSIEIDGTDISTLGAKELSRLVCYVPQEHEISFSYSVEETVLMGRTPHLGGISGPRPEDVEIARAAMEKIGIESLAKRPYTQLSGGQRQMVLIARALAQGSPIMVFDEPTSALDFRNQMVVWNTLKSLKSEGKILLVCTHDPNHALWFCDDLIVLKDGVLVAQGPVESLMTDELLEELYGPICGVKDGVIVPAL